MTKFLLTFIPESFRMQLVVGMGLILSCMILLFVYLETKNHTEFLRAEGLNQALDRSLSLSNMSKMWVMANDYSGIDEVLESFEVYDDLMYAAVINMDGKIIAHTNHALIGQYIADKERIAYLRHIKNKVHTDHTHDVKVFHNLDYIDVLQTVRQKERHIAFVNVRIDQTHREKNIQATMIAGIAFALFYVLVAILFAYLSANRLTNKLLNLIDTMKEIRYGNQDVKADESGMLEISQLAHEFNNMVDSLNANENKVHFLKERLEYAVNGTRDGLWDWNLLTDEVYFSPRWKSMLGYEDYELPNVLETWEKLVYPPDLENAEHDISVNQQTPGLFYENIHRLIHKDGHLVWILDRGQTLFNDEGIAVRMVGFHTDISKQKQLEEELLEKEQMMIAQSRHVAMGEMIGMIAHQWRQPITVIAMGANNILADIALEDISIERFAQEAKDILKQTEYLSKTIDDFRNFFRPNKEKDEVFVQDVLLEAKQIIGKSLEHHNIEYVIEDNDRQAIHTYSRELLQVILNILKNAKEALEEKNIDNGFIHASVEHFSDYVLIRICDNGGGIEDSVLERIFEPYFSTKDKKTGTGLGLYMSKTIVEKHLNGTITAINTDVGACFVITVSKESKTKDTDV
ncbi:MAG TPA: ATP-binding protein [Sulfuricurvum sp.]|nr:ATP-binding protein [Sulfuricurvum sp.]